MFARSGVTLPRGAGTSSPYEVARAVALAVERDRPEITVAAGVTRVSAAIAALAPVLVGRLARLLGAARVREEMIAASRSRGQGQSDAGSEGATSSP